jgi:anti-sigma regulatory factor (Ser/Thr protein kinase)
VRRAASQIGTDLGFSEEDRTRAALVATELANNLLRHAAGKRVLLLQRSDRGDASGVEMIAIDKGPGISDMTEAFRDGYSTAGSAGEGLGAVMRLSNVFDIHSAPGRGTVAISRIYAKNSSPRTEDVAALAVPKTGESDCGDACAWTIRDGAGLFMIADGLGHGPIAAEASAQAVDAFNHATDADALSVLSRIHSALTNTRGAAVAVAKVPPAGGQLTYAGIGNITGVVVADRPRNLVSLHGTAGIDSPRLSAFPAEWPQGAILIMHSDGVNTKWDVTSYPGLMMKHPSVIAGVVYRDGVRDGRDDASVLVYKPAR